MRVVLALWLFCVAVCGCGVRPLPGAFAHNDYAHARPLLDALEHGFGGVEADVFLVGGELRVGHEEKELTEGRTLRSLYLEPLAQRVRGNGGWVYGEGVRFWLMIDVKTEAEPTYAAVREALRPYEWMLTKWRNGREYHGPVTVVLSGNRARKTIEGEADRLLAIDGRLEDLDGAAPAELVPWISANWEKTFTWRGEGKMSAGEREKLREIVAKAHARGRLVRFWATPELPELWRELRAAGVDLINTDDLAGLAGFLR